MCLVPYVPPIFRGGLAFLIAIFGILMGFIGLGAALLKEKDQKAVGGFVLIFASVLWLLSFCSRLHGWSLTPAS